MNARSGSEFTSEHIDHQLQEFGKKVKEFRRARGLTQLDLAESSELDRKTISRIENHQYSPSLITIFSIASALEIEPKDLMP